MLEPAETRRPPPERPGYFPLVLSLDGERALVIGASSKTAAKVMMLRRAGAQVTVIIGRVAALSASTAAAEFDGHAGNPRVA